MLSERIRNSIVGLTMIATLGMLMAGIFTLGRFPTLAQVKPYIVTITSPNASGLISGNKVDFNGVYVGNVYSVQFAPDMRGVRISLDIDSNIDIPANTLVYVGKQTIGTPFISLVLPPDPAHPGQTVLPTGILPKDGTATLHADTADTGLIPKPIVDKLNKVGDDLDVLLQQRSLADYEQENPGTRVANISILVQRLDRVTRGFDTLVGDPKSQQQVREIIANISESSSQLKNLLASANTSLAKANATVEDFGQAARQINVAATQVGAVATQAASTVDTTRQEIIKVSEKLVDVLNSIDKTATAIAQGEGTAGKLVNDPRLYDGLLDLTRTLKSTTDDLNLLLRKWKEEGVRLKLN